MRGFEPPGGVYAHIAGIDMVRTGPDEFYVLEDNCRTPSGVSYMLENREVMMRLFPELFARHTIAAGRATTGGAAGDAALGGAGASRRRADGRGADARAATTAPITSTAFLADADGRRAGRGRGPLRAGQPGLHAHHRRARSRVDVIYRRIDDDFLDPLAFRPDSLLGVPGLLERLSRRQRRPWPTPSAPASPTTRRSTPTCPEMIRFYLGEEPLLDERAHLPLRATRRTAATCSRTSTSWW